MSRSLANARRSIFSAARELLDAQGYAALNMRDVAQKSGVALGTIYNYYENKRALVRDMLVLRWVDFAEKQAAIAATRHDIAVKLYRTYQEYRRFAGAFSAARDMPELSAFSSGAEADAGEADYAERLAVCIEGMLEGEARSKTIRLRRPARDTALFIAMNFAAMSRMPGYHYEVFEGVAKELWMV